LASLGDAEGVAHLFRRAGKRWSLDRAMAIELLGEVKAPGAKERLVQILNDVKDPCRGAAGRGLGRLGDVSAEPELVRSAQNGQLTDDDRLDVAEGLLRLGTQSAKAYVSAMQFENDDARAELAEMLLP
jgi:HEAT repeat protein